MLDGLERADRPAELPADARVLDGRLQAALGAADLLGGERDRGVCHALVDSLGTASWVTGQPARRGGKIQASLWPGGVEPAHGAPDKPVSRSRVDGEQGTTVFGLRGNDDDVGLAAVQDERA